MAWRIADQVASGEIDNRTKGQVTGYLDLAGGAGRITLNLVGNAHPDVAGTLIRFRNPAAKPEPWSDHFPLEQTGTVGDITASHRVKDLLVSLETWRMLDEKARGAAFEWVNCFYIEWFSSTNGRVVIEGLRFELEVLDGPLWTLSEDDKQVQNEVTAAGLRDFLNAVGSAVQEEAVLKGDDDDEEIPPAEAAMDAEVARTNLLIDRITRRLEKEGLGNEKWNLIYREESARLRRERGEPDLEPPNADEAAQQQAWLDQTAEAAWEALAGAEEDASHGVAGDHKHPLVIECQDLAMDLRRILSVPEGASQEHPLAMICDGVLCASGKLAGALHGQSSQDEWPPNALAAPCVLVFLKKARQFLRDALLGLEGADEEQLVSKEWRQHTRAKITHILRATHKLIVEARTSLNAEED